MAAKRSPRDSRLFELQTEERQRKTVNLLKNSMTSLDRAKKAVTKSRELMDELANGKKPPKSQQH